MKETKAHTLLFLYRALGKVCRPLIMPYLGLRALRGKEDMARRRERLGYASVARPEGTLVWLHAASVGESVALIPLIEHIRFLKINVLLTTGTVTSARFVESRFGNDIAHQYAPVDTKSVVRRFLDYWKPELALVCESEIWPTRIVELSRRCIAQILINAHLSEKSYKVWKKRPALARQIFSRFDLAICQTVVDARRYRRLGVRRVDVAGNLKAETVPIDYKNDYKKYLKAIGDRPVWAAISTHEGEELMALEVHSALKKYLPNLLTVIVPRHPERCEKIAAKLAEKKVAIVQKSTSILPDEKTDILLGDTIGDMGFYLRLTQVVFVGKSLCVKGGHNPLEPALVGAAILSGPHVENFKAAYQCLIDDQAACIVEDATQLAFQVDNLLTHPALRKKMMKAAYHSAVNMGGALAKTSQALQPFIQPLAMGARLNSDRQG